MTAVYEYAKYVQAKYKNRFDQKTRLSFSIEDGDGFVWGHGDWSGTPLTPDQARKLGKAIIRLADRAERETERTGT